MEHITRSWKNCQIPKLLVACQQNHLWAEMRFLYCHHEEYDNGIKIMMEHPVEAFDHVIFSDTIGKVSNSELYYKAIQFYIEEQPKYVFDLLSVLVQKLDHERVAKETRQSGNLHLIKKYLEIVQENDLKEVNEALHDLYIEEEDYEALKNSIDEYSNFDRIKLAKQLEDHELLEFRRISALLYKKGKQFKQSIELSKKDKLYKDAMETAAESRDQEICESLLKYFVDNNLKYCFSACLYTCYDFVRPDVALEYAWRYKIQDMAMPYLIQVVREYTTKIDELQKEVKEEKKKKEKAQIEQIQQEVVVEPTYYDPVMQTQGFIPTDQYVDYGPTQDYYFPQ
jgi:clathrin heavy chain